jgi:predicted permease
MRFEHWLYTLPLRVRSLFQRRKVEDELDEEIRDHIEHEMRELVAKGMSEEKAHSAARRKFGGAEQIKEECRDRRGVRFLEELNQDLRYGLRQMRHYPGFTAAAVLTLGLGIGACTTIFNLANGIFVRSQGGIKEPNRLIDLAMTPDGRGLGDNPLCYPDFEYFRDHNQTLAGLSAFSVFEVNLNTGAGPEQSVGMLVSGNFFDVMGCRPARGRFFLPEEDRVPGASPVAVISYRLWQKRYQGATDALGASVTINSHPYTIVGVTQEAFSGPYAGFAPDVWVPLMMQPYARPSGDLTRKSYWLESRGRLRPGTSIRQARTDLTTLANQLSQEYPKIDHPKTDHAFGVVVEPAGGVPGFLFPMVLGFFGILGVVVGLVLLIACSNVASMMLARAAARRKEVAIRLAMGAGRARVIRQALIESAVLFLFGGSAGVLVALASNRFLLSFVPEPIHFDCTVDWRVVGFGLITALAAGLVFGLSPAIQSSRTDLLSALKGVRGLASGSRARSAFVVTQISVSLILLVAAALFLRSLHNAAKIDPGFNADGVITAEFNIGIQAYDEDRGRQFYRQLLDGVAPLRGVLDASLSSIVPLSGDAVATGVSVAGGEEREIQYNRVGPGYFHTLQAPILAGRAFDSSDTKNSLHVVVVNETFARRFFPGADAIGKQFAVGKDTVQVIGIAKDGKYNTPGEDQRAFFYEYTEQYYSPKMTLLVRSNSADLPSVMAAVRRQVAELDNNLPFPEVIPMPEKMGFSLIPLRIAASVAGAIGVLGLVLASVGVFGLVSYSVAQRTAEIGIRMALGAGRNAVLLMVVMQGLKLVAVGAAIGLTVSFALTQALKSLLYGVGAADPLSFAGMTLLLVAVAAIASFIPAWRGSGVDPVTALRYE